MIPPRRPWSGWLDGGHLTLDAVVALVDGEMADGPTGRALAHVDHCLTCAAEVTAQRQARRRLRNAGLPGAPTSLLSSLRAIPESAALPPVPGTLALDAEGRFVVHESEAVAPDTGSDAGSGATGHDGPDDTSPPSAPAAGTPPAGADGPVEPDVPGRGRARLARRTRRRLAVGIPAAVASGVAIGALGVVTAGSPAAPAPPSARSGPAVSPRGPSAASELGARFSLRRDASADASDDRAPGLPGPGER